MEAATLFAPDTEVTENSLFTDELALNVDGIASMYEDAPKGLSLPEEFVPHKPDEDSPQERFLLDMRDEILYGGAAGGGKSDALLMAALQFVHVPNYAAILFRKTYTDLSLEGALMERAHMWLRNTPARWNEQKKKWRFPSGASLTFGYLASTLDKYRYQSAEFQFVGFDELTQFPEEDYRYLFSRLRRPSSGPLSKVPLRMRGASNPGGIGHRWVKASLVEAPETKDRCFIPSKLTDNRHVDREAYSASLEHLDEHTRMQLEEGDWNARMPGPWVYEHQHLDSVFALGDIYDKMFEEGRMPPPAGGSLVLGMDYGESNSVVVGWPLEHNGMLIAHEYTYERGEPDTQAKEFHDRVLKSERFRWVPLGRQRFDASKPESMRLWLRGMREVRELGSDSKPSPIHFNKYKRKTILHQRLMMKRTAEGQLGHLAIIGRTCASMKEQMYDMQFKNDDTEDVVKENDHGPDAGIALCAPLSSKKGS